MKPVKKLMVNYKSQIDYLNKIDRIVRFSRGAEEIETVIEGLRQSQMLLESIMELNEERKGIEEEIVQTYELPEFDLIKLSLKIDNEDSRKLMVLLEELKQITAQVIEGKSEEIERLRDSRSHMKVMRQETLKGHKAFRGYKKRHYESYFINRVSE